MSMKKHKFRQETEAVRGTASLAKKNGPLATPIYQTSTFEVTDMQEQVRVTPTDSFYTRYGNPTNTVGENAIAQLEGTDAALLFSSGMAAITTSILSLAKAGDHIVAQRDIYGGVTKFLSQWLPKLGVETTFVDTNDIAQHERAIRPNTKLLHIESPTNPTVRVVDLEKIAALARKHNLITTIDSTFATPINCRPAEWGIDLVLHPARNISPGTPT
jgi:methionine-gamma-lyase